MVWRKSRAFAAITAVVLGTAVISLVFNAFSDFVRNSPTAAFNGALSLHHPNNLPQVRNQIPFLFLSCFHQGNPKDVLYHAVYDDGEFFDGRSTWNAGGNAGGSPMQNQNAFNQLRHLPVLPAGLSSPNAVSYRRLLIVTQEHNDQWVTTYYDLVHLPRQVVSIMKLCDIQNFDGGHALNPLPTAPVCAACR